jgi:subtilisin family serine protease
MPTQCERTRGASTGVNLRLSIHQLIVLVFLLPALLADPRTALANNSEQGSVASYRDGIVLMAFRDGTQPAQQNSILASVGAREIKHIGVGVHVVAVKPGQVFATINSLKALQAVRYAEPDFLQTLSASTLPDDTFVGIQWAVRNTGQNVNGSSGTAGADERTLAAWGVTTGTNSVVIAELDTGVQYSHPDLFTNIWNNPGGINGCSAGTHGYNVLSSSCDPMDDDGVYGGHGTHVAGIMGAVGNNAAGTAGVNWTASIMAVKWVNSSGTGATSDLITGLDWVVSAKQAGINVRVANDSQTWPGTAFSQALSDEIDLLGSNDILFVTASGNTAQNNDAIPRYPCSYARPTMICVAASTQFDTLWSSANFGPNSVQLAAPGVNIYSTLRASDYGYISGGSMASPQVAGAAALILSLGYQPVANLRTMILNNVDVLSSLSELVGTGGRLNVCKAVPGCSSAVAGKPVNSTAPVVTSLPIQGGLLGASTGAWTGIPSVYTYQWNRCNQNGSNCSPIPGATGQTYALLAPADSLATLTVTVTASNSFGSVSATSIHSSAVVTATSASAITSSIVSGSTVSGSVNWTVTPSRSEQFVQFYIDGVLTQTDSTSPYVFNSSTTSLLDTTTLSNGPHVLGVRALFTDNRTYDFFGENVTIANPPQNTALPTISGTVIPGQTISTSKGSWAASVPPTSFSYQWEHCDSNGLNCAFISNATSSNYLLSGADTTFTMRSVVTASNSAGSTAVASAQTAVVPPPPLAITTLSLPGAVQNIAYSTTLAASGGVAPYTWSISAGALPGGLAIASGTGVISGTPTGTGTTNFTVQVTDTMAAAAKAPLSLTVAVPLSITTTSLPVGTQLASYSSALAATGGTPPYSWSIASGALPSGLALSPGTGVISGTSTTSGTNNFTVRVTDSNSLNATQPLSLSINGILSGGSGIALVQANAVQGSNVGSVSAAFPISTTAGNLIIAFVRMSTTSQTVTLADNAGNTYVQAVKQPQNSDGSQACLFYAKNISGAAVNTVTATFSSTNNHPWLAIYEFSGLSTTNPLDQIASAQGNSTALNSGLTPPTTSANELIFGGSGLPASSSGKQTAGSGFTMLENNTATSRAVNEVMLLTSTGPYSATFTVSSSTNWSALVATFVSGAPTPPVVTTTSLPNGTQTAVYSATLTASGGATPYTWSITAGTLPPGLTLAPGTGVISGTPTGTETSTFTVQVTDANLFSGSNSLSITVIAPPTVTTTSLPNGTQNAGYSTTLAAIGGTTPYTWSVSSGTLPAGLSVVSSSGVISGTPTGTGTTNFTVQVTDANSVTATQPLSITVVAPPLTVTTHSLPNGTQNSAYSTTLAATGGTTPYSWSISAGTLPTGLSLVSSTGVISGTPTATGTSNFTVQVTDANSATATQPLSLNVVAPQLTVTTTSLPNGTQNAGYSTTLTATGGTTPYTWSISAGTLPTGLSLASSTGVISGTPTATGTSNFTMKVTDANSATATQPLSLAVVAPPLTVTTTSLPNGTQNAAYSTTLTATGGTTPYTWSISAGTLPTGLSLVSSTGVISGTPSATGTSNFTVKVTDANSATATQPLSLTVVVAPLTVVTTSLANGTQNIAYSVTLTATGGTAPYSWSITVGTLPSGLTLASSTGVISGTPSATGTSNFTVQVSDSNSQTATKSLSITVNSSSGGGIGLIQQNAVQGTSVGSLSVAFPTGNTAGNLILAFVRMSTTTQTVTLKDSAGNTYVEAVAQVQSSDGSQVHLFYAKSILGVANTVTATFSASNNHPWLAIYEYKGLNAANPLDQTAHAQGNSTSPNSGPTATTTSANELIFAAMGLPARYSGTQTVGSGYNLLQNDTSTSPASNESMLVTSTGAYAATFKLSTADNWSAIVATFMQ